MSRSARRGPTPIIFQHIPKTAGVSVRSVMSCQFDVDDILHVPDSRWRDAGFAAEAAGRYRLIHGHIHFEFLRDVLDRTQVMTFLRDPIERVFSLYFFLRNQDPGTTLDPGLRFAVEAARALPPDEFAAHPDPVIASMVSNYQIRMLLSDADSEQPESAWVDRALANLERYRFVGICDPDLMPTSMLMMSRTFGWIGSADSPRVNHTLRSGWEAELAGARTVIEAANRSDIELVARVRERIRERAPALSRFKTRERTALKTQRRKYSTGVASPVTMDLALRCWGWHDREVNSTGEYWRCGAQMSFGLELKVPVEEILVVLFSLRSAHPRISVPDTVVSAGGRVLQSRIVTADNRWVIAAVVERRDIDSDGIVSVQFTCKEGDTPDEADAPRDNRFVTLALQTIDVMSAANCGPRARELLKHWVLNQEPEIRRHQLIALQATRDRELADAARYQAALTERAERAEAYGGSLKAALQTSEAALKAREGEMARGAAYVASLIERGERAESYAKLLAQELESRRSELQQLCGAYDKKLAEAVRYESALLERAERGESYGRALLKELEERRLELQGLRAARDRELAEASRYQSALVERAERAESYAAALAGELERRTAELKALQLPPPDGGSTEAAVYQAALVERAERAEAYSGALVQELDKQRRELQALQATKERELTAAAQYQDTLVERAERAESYARLLTQELESRHSELQQVRGAYDGKLAEAVKYESALLERTERAESYAGSLAQELENRRAETEGLTVARQSELTEAAKYQSALVERAERAETYAASLQSALETSQNALGALQAGREREAEDAEAFSRSLIERAERAEAYGDSLAKELQVQRGELQALRERAERFSAAGRDPDARRR